MILRALINEMLSPRTFGHGYTIYVLLIERRKMGDSDGAEIRRVFQQSAVDAFEL